MKKNRILILILALVLILGACKSSNKSMEQASEMASPENHVTKEINDTIDPQVESLGEEAYENAPSEKEDSSPAEKNLRKPDLIIKSAYFDAQTKAFDNFLRSLSGYMKSVNAYYEQYEISGSKASETEVGNRWANLMIRVPKDQYDQLMEKIKADKDITILHENMNSADVSRGYRDTESRIKTLEEKENRLLELIAKAETMEAIIALENSLSETVTEKEILKQDKLSLDDQISYSTIQLSIYESNGAISAENKSFVGRLGLAFQSGLSNFVLSIQNMILFLVGKVIPILFCIAVVILIIFILKKLFNKFYKKKEDPKEI